jgi:predicted nucleotidyltransferase component of viral defense system
MRDLVMVMPPWSESGAPSGDGVVPDHLPCGPRRAEVLTEKLRAVLGQRRFAVSRDLFDIHQLIRGGVDEPGVHDALPAKLNGKGFAVTTVTADRMLSRKAEFLVDWTRNLTPLVQPAMLPEFEEAWKETTELLERVLAL